MSSYSTEFSVEGITAPSEFIEQCSGWLSANDDNMNETLLVAHAIDNGHPSFVGSRLWVVWASDGSIAGTLIVTATDRVLLPIVEDAVVKRICDFLNSEKISLSGVSSSTHVAVCLAERWALLTGIEWSREFEWQAFCCDSIVLPTAAAQGHLRLAREAERDLVEEWAIAYQNEKPAPIDVPTFLLGKIALRELYLWEDQEPRTIIAVAKSSGTSAKISAVYTPPWHRRMGYASVSVACATKMLIEQGARSCSLVVDIDDVRVMRIYENIGFKRTSSRSLIQFQ